MYRGIKSRHSVVDIVTRLRAGQSEVWILVEARYFAFLQIVPAGSGAHPASYSMGIGVLSRRLKRPVWDVDHLPPTSAVVKNEWS